MDSRNRQKRTPPGEMVDIGGFRLHALVRGHGTPTVLLEPAMGGFIQQYAKIQSEVSAFTGVMAYERAGQGWSDSSPNPRTPAHLSVELKALLERLDLQPPYVLVGHSFGGLLNLIYTGYHPEEVAGVVLVDSSDVEMYDAFPDLDQNVRQAAMGVRLLKFVSKLGLGKQLTKMSMGDSAKSISKEDLDTFLTTASQPKHQETMLAEFSQHRLYFGPQSEVPRTIGDTPLIVVTAGDSVSDQRKVGTMTGEEVNAQHQRAQKKLVQLSSRGEHLIVPGATHLSILFQPEHIAQVVDAIRRMVEIARAENQRSERIS